MEGRKEGVVNFSTGNEESCWTDKENDEMLDGLYGPPIHKRHCVGYCKYHKCYMTFKQIKKKECLQKQCKALERISHQFWRQREIKKIKKKEKDKENTNL